MIGQYLSNKNENATVAKSEIFSKLNKALDTPKNPKLYKIPCHIESCDTCMEY